MMRLIGVALAVVLSATPAIADCTFASQIYGQGAVKRHDDGLLYKCEKTEWIRHPSAFIRIAGALYGGNGVAPYIIGPCNNQVKCSVVASDSSLGGNPGPGRSKDLVVKFYCVRSGEKIPGSDAEQAVAENHRLELNCEKWEKQ